MNYVTAVLAWLGNALGIAVFLYVLLYFISPTIRKETWGTVYQWCLSWWWSRLVEFAKSKMPKKANTFKQDDAMELSHLIQEHGENSPQVAEYIESHPELTFLVNLSRVVKPVVNREGNS